MEDDSGNGASLSVEPGERGTFTGDPEGHVKEGSGNGHFFP